MRPSRRTHASLVEYGTIGDLHTCALVGRDGSVDWTCWPRLDSPSVFAALLDPERGGHFQVAPAGTFESSQSYLPDTNVLRTEFSTSKGRGVLTDFLPVQEIDRDEYAFQELHRILEVSEGRLEFESEFAPRFDYGRAPTRLQPHPGGILAEGAGHTLALGSDAVFVAEGDAAYALGTLEAGGRARFVLRFDTPFVRPVDEYESDRKLSATAGFWRAWGSRANVSGRWSDAVRRSLLTLKLLTYAPTGALAAAATTSLPETPGGSRNWDYRYSWVRDSSFAMQAFTSLGYHAEARRYLRWLRRLLRGLTLDLSELRICYGLEGEAQIPEEELAHFRGYLDSTPVRVGNAAIEQTQNDIYGSLVDAIYLAYRLPEGFPDEAWRTVRSIAEYVVRRWETPDHGLWEIRGPRRRYTHSALMCWVALDRAIKIAQDRRHHEYYARWSTERDRIHQAILTQGWDEARGAFVQSFGSHDLDASLLLVPILGFLDARDPRVLSTIKAIEGELADGPYVHRYRNDDALAGQEGAFLTCSFWMVHALALAGRHDEASQRFDALQRLAGPLGLFSEEVDPKTRRALGNFPQALTHLAHVHAALALELAQAPSGGAREEPAIRADRRDAAT